MWDMFQYMVYNFCFLLFLNNELKIPVLYFLVTTLFQENEVLLRFEYFMWSFIAASAALMSDFSL